MWLSSRQGVIKCKVPHLRPGTHAQTTVVRVGASNNAVHSVHYVQAGETLADIANKHGCSVRAIKELNYGPRSVLKGDGVEPGKRLKIPARSAAVVSVASAPVDALIQAALQPQQQLALQLAGVGLLGFLAAAIWKITAQLVKLSTGDRAQDSVALTATETARMEEQLVVVQTYNTGIAALLETARKEMREAEAQLALVQEVRETMRQRAVAHVASNAVVFTPGSGARAKTPLPEAVVVGVGAAGTAMDTTTAPPPPDGKLAGFVEALNRAWRGSGGGDAPQGGEAGGVSPPTGGAAQPAPRSEHGDEEELKEGQPEAQPLEEQVAQLSLPAEAMLQAAATSAANEAEDTVLERAQEAEAVVAAGPELLTEKAAEAAAEAAAVPELLTEKAAEAAAEAAAVPELLTEAAAEPPAAVATVSELLTEAAAEPPAAVATVSELLTEKAADAAAAVLAVPELLAEKAAEAAAAVVAVPDAIKDTATNVASAVSNAQEVLSVKAAEAVTEASDMMAAQLAEAQASAEDAAAAVADQLSDSTAAVQDAVTAVQAAVDDSAQAASVVMTEPLAMVLARTDTALARIREVPSAAAQAVQAVLQRPTYAATAVEAVLLPPVTAVHAAAASVAPALAAVPVAAEAAVAAAGRALTPAVQRLLTPQPSRHPSPQPARAGSPTVTSGRSHTPAGTDAPETVVAVGAYSPVMASVHDVVSSVNADAPWYTISMYDDDEEEDPETPEAAQDTQAAVQHVHPTEDTQAEQDIHELAEVVLASVATPVQQQPPVPEPEPKVSASQSKEEAAASVETTAAQLPPPPPIYAQTVEGMKAALMDGLYAAGRGAQATAEQRAIAEDLIAALECRNPSTRPSDCLPALNGRWKLVYTSSPQTLLLLSALDNLPLVELGDVYQDIDTATMTAHNKIDVKVPLQMTLHADTRMEVRTPRALKVNLTRIGVNTFIQTPQLLMALDVPDTVDLWGTPLDLTPVRKYVVDPFNAVLETSKSIWKRATTPEIDLEPTDATTTWMLTTYLDDSMRINRDASGNVFVMLKDTQEQ